MDQKKMDIENSRSGAASIESSNEVNNGLR